MAHRFTRRDVVRFGAAAALAGPHFALATEKKSPKLRLAVKYGMVRPGPEATVLDKFELVKKIGFEGLEISAPGEVDTASFAQAVRALIGS